VAKRQTRRSISFRAEAFERIRQHCKERGLPVSAWAEIMLGKAMDGAGTPDVAREDALAELQRRRDEKRAKRDAKHCAGVWTF